MDREQQNLAWGCLPKEMRTELKVIFNMPSKNGYSDSVRQLLIDIYGDNLSSNSEPEELLYVERDFIIDYYRNKKKLRAYYEDGQLIRMMEQQEGHLLAIKHIFGDKCLPDMKFNVNDIVVYHPFKTNSFYEAKVLEIRRED